MLVILIPSEACCECERLLTKRVSHRLTAFTGTFTGNLGEVNLPIKISFSVFGTVAVSGKNDTLLISFMERHYLQNKILMHTKLS